MDWARMLAYITGTVDQELLLRNEYLVAENRILKAQLKTPLRLTDAGDGVYPINDKGECYLLLGFCNDYLLTF